MKYQATATKAGEFVEWRDASGKIVSNDAVYTTTAEEDITLTAVSETLTMKRLIRVF